jgi:hypothetical protein
LAAKEKQARIDAKREELTAARQSSEEQNMDMDKGKARDDDSMTR